MVWHGERSRLILSVKKDFTPFGKHLVTASQRYGEGVREGEREGEGGMEPD